MKRWALIFTFLTLPVQADILEDFDSLGANKVLLEKAQALAPNNRIQIVQERVVNRFARHEITTDYEVVSSGANPYFNTQGLGLSYQFHLNPHWSVGVKYSYAFNQLSAEGDKIIEDGRARQEAILRKDPNSDDRPDAFIPELNWVRQSYLLMVNWYPIYGKFKFLNSGIVHFDIYTHIAIGEIQLRYNTSPLYQGGLGMGFWWSQHLSSRVEYRFSSYRADFYDSSESINTGNLGLSLGYLL